MISDIIVTFFGVILQLVMNLITLIMLPIDAFIYSVLPDLSNALDSFGSFISYIVQGLGWAISASGIPFATLALIATYFIFKLTLPLQIWFIKLTIAWFKTLKR